LAVIVTKDKMHGFDAAEIFRVHDMLPARLGMDFGVQVDAQFGDHRIEHRYTGNLELSASVLEAVAQVFVDDGIKYKLWIFADAGNNFLYLVFRSDHGPEVLIRLD
jgi:hypothetical protein